MRALLSVWDKTGLVEFADGPRRRSASSWSPRAARRAALADAGIAHLDVAEVTGFPEMLDGRVKTLHPRIHARHPRRPLEARAPRRRSRRTTSTPIDLVVCNLYPFSSNPSIELIDIGGPTMVRAAAKNHEHVGVVTSPEPVRRRARRAARRTARCRDATRHAPGARGLRPHRRLRRRRSCAGSTAAARSARRRAAIDAVLPETLHLTLERADVVRYGENPHQVGARYRVAGTTPWWDGVVQHAGSRAVVPQPLRRRRGVATRARAGRRRARTMRRSRSSSTPTPRAPRSASSLADAFDKALARRPPERLRRHRRRRRRASTSSSPR